MNLELGKNIKRLRRQKDLTQDELAEKLSLSTQAISRYETGASYPDIEMLPVIAGFFGISVDELLGVTVKDKERRLEEYSQLLRNTKDRKERLEILRRELAEFPGEWAIVSDMVYEMTYLPECLDEMRDIVNDAVKRCDDILCRENLIFFYIQSEPDENIANDFIEKWCSRYNMMKVHLLNHRYTCRGEHDKQKSTKQKILRDQIIGSMTGLMGSSNGNIEEAKENCRNVLQFLSTISNNDDIRKPDMWISTKLLGLLRLANSCFISDETEEGFTVLEDAVCLFENFFSLDDTTVLTHGTNNLDKLSAKTNKQVFYGVTEFSGIIAKSMMTKLIYMTPVGPINENAKHIYDMEAFHCEMVFSSHTSDTLSSPAWDGFTKVKENPRFVELRERAKAISSIESINNLMFLVNTIKNRNDEFVKNVEWASILLVKDVGAYIIWDESDIKEKIDRMKNEENTMVYRIVTVGIGKGIIKTPESVAKRLIEMNENNKDAQVILQNASGELIYSKITD